MGVHMMVEEERQRRGQGLRRDDVTGDPCEGHVTESKKWKLHVRYTTHRNRAPIYHRELELSTIFFHKNIWLLWADHVLMSFVLTFVLETVCMYLFLALSNRV